VQYHLFYFLQVCNTVHFIPLAGFDGWFCYRGGGWVRAHLSGQKWSPSSPTCHHHHCSLPHLHCRHQARVRRPSFAWWVVEGRRGVTPCQDRRSEGRGSSPHEDGTGHELDQHSMVRTTGCSRGNRLDVRTVSMWS
jgi:hypothetical protein